MSIQEHYTPASLTTLINEINQGQDESWSMINVRKDFLKQITSEAFLAAITPILKAADAAHVYFINNNAIYVAWKGQRKRVYKSLLSLVSTVMIQPGLMTEPTKIVAYIDPLTGGEDIKAAMGKFTENTTKIQDFNGILGDDDDDEIDDLDDDQENILEDTSGGVLGATQTQLDFFRATALQKPYRKQMQVLVVEDQVFSQKLLCEIIRSARTNNNDVPQIEALQSMQSAWKAFLKKAPDIVFVDLGLTDGSGHALAKAIKTIDPITPVIVVTANDSDEESAVARQNNVDAFISKPYSKKAILDCIDRYVTNHKKKPGRDFYG